MPAHSGRSDAATGGESNLTRFWALQGRRVFAACGATWAEYKGGFFTSIAPQVMLDLSPAETREALRGRGVYGLRFPSLHRPGMRSGLYVCRPAGHNLRKVSRKMRGHVTKGLESCRFAPVDPAELLSAGLPLNRDTLARQGRHDATFEDPAQWKRLVDAVAACPGLTVHGAYVEGRLASYVISCRDGEWLHLLYKMSSTEALVHCPNHALDYTILQDAARMPGVAYVASGNTSVVPNEGLDRYKRQMGFEVIPHNLCLHFHPALAPIATSQAAVSLAGWAAAAWPAKHKLSYAARMLASAQITAEGNGPPEDPCR